MKLKLAFVFAFALLICFQGECFALFGKHKKEEIPDLPPMVHTVEEWQETARDIKMDMREREKDPFEKEDKYIPAKELPAKITSYNYRPGSRELDLSKIYKTKFVRSPFIISPLFDNAIYSEVYYFPQTRQFSSTLFLIEPDKDLSKKERFADLDIFEHQRRPLISASTKFLKEQLFDTLTVVDFSSDGKKILVKETRGSNKYGIYETYAWVYFLTDEKREENQCFINNYNFVKDKADNLSEVPKEKLISAAASIDYENVKNYIEKNLPDEKKISPYSKTRWYNKAEDFTISDFYIEDSKTQGFGVRLSLLNEMIKAYWFDRKQLILNYIRWDLRPLGFNKNDKNEIIALAIAFNKNGDEISLGRFGVNLVNGLPRVIPDNEEIQIQSNSFILEKRLN